MPTQSTIGFSIVIPVKAINGYVRETVPHILRLKDADWELIIVPNDESPTEWPDPRIRLMASGRVGPGAKRDMAAKVARGDVLVFLDDDSYPREDLLSVARVHFADLDVVALGGPAITPPQDDFWQKVSGTVFVSRFSGGSPERYIPMGAVRGVQDWPSVNLMVRKPAFLSIGGFNTPFWPGEDTKLCLALVKTGKKILYVPDMIVWHHRRAGLLAHVKQVGAYGLHRGFFVKHYPETSLKPGYFAPAAFLFFCLVSIPVALGPVPPAMRLIFALGWVLYGLALLRAFFDFVSHAGVPVACCSLYYTVCTHLVYGFQFMRGLFFTKNLVSQLR